MEEFRTDSEKINLNFDIFGITRRIRKCWWIILLSAAMVGMLYNVLKWETYSPQYQTTASFLVALKTTTAINTRNVTDLNTMTNTFAELLPSQMMQDLVADNLDLLKFEGSITASAVPNTNILELSVMADSPRMSFQIMKSITNNYPDLSSYVLSNAVLEELEPIRVPTQANEVLNSRKNFSTGFVGGLAVAIGLLGVVFYFNDTIKSEKDIENKLDLSLFGTIREEGKKWRRRRKHKPLLFTDIKTSFYFKEDVKKIRAKLGSRMSRKSHKILLVTSALENEGKSTISANIALALAQSGKKVLLIDADFKKPALHKIFDYNMQNKVQISDILSGNRKSKDCICYDETTKLYTAFQKDSISDSGKLLENERMKEFLTEQRQEMDYIILDSSPVKVSADVTILSAMADEVLLVIRQDSAKAKVINDAVDVLSMEHVDLIGCIYNRVKNHPVVYRYGYGNRRYYGYGRGYGYRYGYKAQRRKTKDTDIQGELQE